MSHLINPRVKLVILSVLAALGLLIILQNTESVETRILFARVAMPRAALLFLTLLIGFLLGVLTSWRASRSKS